MSTQQPHPNQPDGQYQAYAAGITESYPPSGPVPPPVGNPAGPFPVESVNTPGRVSLSLGIILVLCQAVVSFLTPAFSVWARDWSMSMLTAFNWLNGVSGVITLLVGLAAVITGAIGLSRRGGPARPRAAAGAGLALGASALLVRLVTLMSSLLIPTL